MKTGAVNVKYILRFSRFSFFWGGGGGVVFLLVCLFVFALFAALVYEGLN